MNSNALNNICSSHEYEYFVYFEKITFSESVIEKTLNENNVLYYSSQTDTNNKILVELQKNYDVNNKYYFKSAQPGIIVIYYSINYKFKCTPNYQTFEDNDNDSDKILSYNKMISINVDGCNENCENCVEDNEMFECQKCKDGYYPPSYFENCCYDELEGFMLKDDKWVECFDSCATCSKANEDIPYYETFKDIQMYCTSCKEGYYKMIGNESQCFSEYESSYLNITIDKEDEVIETNNNITNINNINTSSEGDSAVTNETNTETNNNITNINNINISSEGDLAVINEANKILNSITKLLKNNDIESLLYTKNEIENPNYKENGSNIEKIIIQVYDNTINAQDNAFFNNLSSINITSCESYFKETYNIPDNESIRILKLDVIRSDMKIHQVGYEFYSENGTLLEPNNCNVIVSSPVKLNTSDREKISFVSEQDKKFDMLDINNEFYNDICSNFKSEYGTDVILVDREKDYYLSNYHLCQDNCDYAGFNSSLEKINCNCSQKAVEKENQTQIEKLINANEKFSVVEFKKSAKNVFKNSNLRIIKCKDKIFNENLKRNGGFICLTIVLSLNLIGLIVFFVYHLKNIKTLFHSISNPPKTNESASNRNIITDEKLVINNINKDQEKNVIETENENYMDEIKDTETKPKIYNEEDENKEYNDEELNDMDYEHAIKYDKRSYLKYYFSRLKYCHLLIFTFYTKDDNNDFILKVSLLLNGISLLLTINSLFFNDESITHVHREKGKFDFIYELPKIILSTLISVIINFLMKFLCLTHDDIYELKKLEEKDKLKKESNSKYKKFNIKIIIFYVLLIALNIFYIYYISIFCSVYKNTQLYLFKDTITSFATSMLYPFIFALIPTIFRMTGLKKEKKCLFSFGKLLQLLA